VDFFES
jgi:hypothetical protein